MFSSSDSDSAFKGFMLSMLIFALIASFSFSKMEGCYQKSKMEENIQQEAVKHKAGEYYLDKDNNKKFRWNDEKEGEIK